MDEASQLNGKFFTDLMRDKRISLREMSAKMGFSHHAQLSRIFKGERRMQLDEAVKLSTLLSIPFDDVIANAGYPQAVRSGNRVRVVGALTGSGIVEPITGIERAVAPLGAPKGAIAIQARCSDTRLSWLDTWVFFCLEPSGIKNDIIGRFCYIKLKNGPSVLATIRRGYSSDAYNLSGPYEKQDATIEWAEPIIMTRN